MNKILQYTLIGAAAFLTNIGIARAQDKTIDGYVRDKKDNPVEDASLMLNTPKQETTTTNENGFYSITTKDFPVGIFTQERIEELKIWPNPASNQANIEVPDLEGTIKAFNLDPKLLGQARASDNSLQFNTNDKLVILQYTNKDGEVQTEKLLLHNNKEKNVTINIQNNYNQFNNNELKNATLDDTHKYVFTITGESFKNISADIINFYVGQTNHSQNFTVNSITRIIDENYTGETFETDTLRVPLTNVRYTDNDDNPTINFEEGDAAKIRNDTLLVYGNAALRINFNDGENEDITSQVLNYIQNNPTITVQGKTIIIGKVADARNYNLNDPEYVASRKEGNLTFMLTNADGTFYEQITSDEQGNFTQEVPAKGKYFYMIESGKTHEALVQIIADSIINNEVIGAMTTNASRADNMQLHMIYQKLNANETIWPSEVREPKTVNWKTEFLEEGGMDHAFIDKVYDYKVNQFTEDITQLMKDTIHNTRILLDQYVNNFFANGNKKWESDASGFIKDQRTTTYWYSGKLSVGTIGRTVKNNTLVSASIGFNKDYFGNNRNSTILALLQEQLSVKTMGELLYPENLAFLMEMVGQD